MKKLNAFFAEALSRKMGINHEKLANEFKPNKIKCLFIAESYPNNDNNYFYNYISECIPIFYSSIMDVLYNNMYKTFPKKFMLEQFKKDGFFLVDTIIGNIPKGTGLSKKILILKKAYEEHLAIRLNVLEKERCIGKTTPIIILLKPTLLAISNFLKNKNYNIINFKLEKDKYPNEKYTIPFPSGNNTNITAFKSRLKECLKIIGFKK
ncbi:hypothetical protein D6745_02835 [Candidatus Woesearchaeota archaeon]|nr:MAG: hypothetical protein D6745_02835 [Candidatus Woesearchaeota archaeon]